MLTAGLLLVARHCWPAHRRCRRPADPTNSCRDAVPRSSAPPAADHSRFDGRIQQ
ncbi:hypothetical protein I552_2105 [Mycobacterium xenopi 3993]|nr:hypothetical protein I552_2105 [Mycobacterium xenopi 3993]